MFCYNVQPGIDIDYATGDSEISPDYTGEVDNSGDNSGSDSGDASGSSREMQMEGLQKTLRQSRRIIVVTSRNIS